MHLNIDIYIVYHTKVQIERAMDAMFSRVLFLIISLSLFAGRYSAEKAQALFVFGDSYADTGNRSPYNQSENRTWRKPYGFTWPGYPTGRFSSGKIQTDFWAHILGLPVPIAYEQLKSHDCKANAKKIVKGVNFAVGGSGIFRAYGFITVAQQVKQFKKLMGRSHGFDSHKFSRSVVLISVAGNDYGSFLRSRNGSLEGLMDWVEPVVSGIVGAVRELYKSGLRNFVVSNVGPFGCAPKIGKTSCDSSYDDFVALHTRLLRESAGILKSDLKELSIVISDLLSAAHYIFFNPAQFGFVELFVPCCAMKGGIEMCGEMDERGRALYEVCSNADERFFWDSEHPTQGGWNAIMSLYVNGAAEKEEENKTISFVEGAPNLIQWVQTLGFEAYNIST